MTETKEVGGGKATGLADDFIGMLQSLMNTGGTGTAGAPNATGQSTGIMGVLSDLLSAGGGKAGGNLASIFSKQQDRDVNQLRARFGVGGGTAFGTPAAFAESTYRADAAPKIGQAISGMQMNAIAQLLSSITGLSGKGISQRETIQQKTGLGQALDFGAAIGKNALPFLLPGVGGPAAGALSGAMQSIDSYKPRVQNTTSYPMAPSAPSNFPAFIPGNNKDFSGWDY
jgi:hypothetical protein